MDLTEKIRSHFRNFTLHYTEIMKQYVILLVLSLVATCGYSRDRELRAYLDSKQFYAPGVGNYVEFHLQFVGHSVNYVGVEGGLQGELAVQMQVLKNGEIIQSDAYRLNSPIMRDSIVEDFYDVQRFVLEPGVYEFSIVLQDLKSDNPPLQNSVQIVVDDLSNSISLSDIEIAEAGTKGDGSSPFYRSGYDIIPRLSTFYPQELNSIPVYFEIYNSGALEQKEFGIRQTVMNADKNIEIESLTNFTRFDTAQVVPVLKMIDISELPTGKYIVSYTVLNRNMMELSSQTYEFERSNDIELDIFDDEIVLNPEFQASITADSVGFYLESLIPISRATETKNIIAIAKLKDEEQARRYIQSYWSKTAPENPYEGWIAYKKQVQLVERIYANNFQEGFETDRGRVYLQYGSPNSIITRDFNPSEYPYEIWRYNKIGAFSNKRFVFYNPDLVNNAYRLLHSDMVGELKNPAWERDLMRRNSTNGNVDDPNSGVIDHWGGKAGDDFINN